MPDNPQDQRAEWEAKVTSFLLGELAPEEADVVRRQIAQNAELAQWEAQLKLTMELVRESLHSPKESAVPQAAPLRMSELKRERLLAHFKTVKVNEAKGENHRSTRVVFWTAIAAGVALLAVVSLPSLNRARSTSQTLSIRQNLRLFDAAKRQLFLEKGISQTTSPTMHDIKPYFGHGSEPADGVAGETYVLGPISQVPVAVLKDRIITPEGEVNLSRLSPAEVSDELKKIGIAPKSSPQTGQATLAARAAGQSEASQQIAAYVPPGATAPLGSASLPTQHAVVPNLSQGLAQGARFQEGTPQTRGQSQASSPPFASGLESQMPANTWGDATPDLALGDNPAAGRAFRNATPNRRGVSARDSSEAVAGVVLARNPGEQFNYKSVPSPETPESTAPAAPNIPAPTDKRSEFAQNLVRSKTPPPSVDDSFPEDKVAQLENKEAARDVITQTVTNVVDAPLPRTPAPTPVPAAEVQTADNRFSTFSLNVSDVSFRLAAATLEKGQMPEPGSVRPEEFLNAFDYHDPEPAAGVKVSFAWDRCADPFAHHRDFLRFGLKTAAEGREGSRPLNIVLLLDKSGSMERADRVEITRKMLEALGSQLRAADTLSVVVFARTPRLWADGVAGDKAADTLQWVGNITPEGGTDLEAAMRVAYETALRHYATNGENRVVLLTDGAANLGEIDPVSLKKMVGANRAQGVAFDCFGVGWEGYNDELLEALSRAGGGRYGFINKPEDAAEQFAGQLAGALRVAAYDVKAQVEFNPRRVTSWRQIGYAKDQLTREQFRDNSVKAAQLGAAESGNAMYVVEINPAGDGPIATVRVRYRLPGSNEYREQEWEAPYTGRSLFLDNSPPAMRLAATACAFSEWLQNSPQAGQISLDRLELGLNGIPEAYGADPRPKLLETMVREARSISGK